MAVLLAGVALAATACGRDDASTVRNPNDGLAGDPTVATRAAAPGAETVTCPAGPATSRRPPDEVVAALRAYVTLVDRGEEAAASGSATAAAPLREIDRLRLLTVDDHY